MRAAAWMNSTESGPHAGVLLDEIDAALQIVAAEKNVVEQGRHLIDQRHVGFLPLLNEKSSWREYRACGEADKGAAWNVVRHERPFTESR